MNTSPSAWTVNLPADRYFVVGAGSGIGRGVALALAQIGKTVYIGGRRKHRLEETVELGKELPGRIVPIPFDISDAQQVENAFAQIEADGGPLPALVNCAAEATYTEARNLTAEQFKGAVDVMLLGAFYVLHRWGKKLIETGKTGCAVMLTSGGADRGVPGVSHSSAAKAGVESMVRAFAREWGPYGLRLNIMGVGAFPVEKSGAMWEQGPIHDRMMSMIALRRYGTRDEAVGPIMFLLSDAAGYVTGETLQVEGGSRLHPWVVEPTDIAAGHNNRYEGKSRA